MFYLLEGKDRAGGKVIAREAVIDQQLTTATTRLLLHPEITLVEVRSINDKEWMRFQRDKAKEKRQTE